jgi:membrane protein implicated in regulation of membrane protease activity
VLFVVGIVLFLVLPDPWNWVALGACLVVGTIELLIWQRTVKGLRVRTGAAALIGAQATVVSPCHPLGMVAVKGERWQARCDDGADTGDAVTIVGRNDLVLSVTKSPP